MYLGCILDETLSEKSMATHVINKVNSRLRFIQTISTKTNF